MKALLVIPLLTCTLCLMAGLTFSQNRNTSRNQYDGVTTSAALKLPYDDLPGLQVDVRWGRLRLGFGGSIHANATVHTTLLSSTTFKESALFAEIGWNPIGIWQVNKEGRQSPCYSFGRIKKGRSLLALAPLLGLGYQNARVSSSWEFQINETLISESYSATVQYPYAHAGLEVHFWKFLYLAIGYKGGVEIPHSASPEMMDILLDPTEQVYGFRFEGHSYAKLGVSLFFNQ